MNSVSIRAIKTRGYPRRRTQSAVVIALFVLLALAVVARAADPDKPFWQRASLPKPGLPYIFTKAAKPEAELPPKEAANACLGTAKELFDQGYDHEATLLFERARKLDPKHTEVSRYLAVLYDRQNDPIRANTEFEQALKLAPKDADLLNDIGFSHYRRSEWSAAEKRFREALVLNPKFERAKVNLGMAIGQQGRFSEAYDVFAAAWVRRPHTRMLGCSWPDSNVTQTRSALSKRR